jgi:hypothetical protein
VLPVIAVQLYHLREVGLSSENVLDSLPVKVESVSRDLEAVLWRDTAPQIRKELVRSFAVALPYGVSRNQLCFGVKGNEHPSVTHFRRVLSFNVALLFLAVSPDFIRLNPFALEILHRAFEQLYAALSGENEQSHDSVTVHTSDSLGTADTGSLNQELNSQKCFAFRHCHAAEKPRMFFCVGFATLRTAKSLQPIAVSPEFPASQVALGAFHG